MPKLPVTLRPARTTDVPAIQDIVRPHADSRVLLQKEKVAYYEAIQEFVVAVDESGDLVGFGALHVMWEHLAEVRTLAVSDRARGGGVGHALLAELLDRARAVGVSQVFCLTFEVDFFTRHGFDVIEGQVVNQEVFSEMLRSRDTGVAEFLDLAWVKPNTLGNTRMLLTF